MGIEILGTTETHVYVATGERAKVKARLMLGLGSLWDGRDNECHKVGFELEVDIRRHAEMKMRVR